MNRFMLGLGIGLIARGVTAPGIFTLEFSLGIGYAIATLAALSLVWELDDTQKKEED